MDPPTNLPAALDSFLGRQQEISEVAVLLAGCRLVTLTGSPGVGKTRLGLAVAAHLADRYPDGAFLVELGPVVEAAMVPHAVAQALSIAEEPGTELRDTLTARLRGQRLLLVLDNCEHLVAAAADVATSLLGPCPGVSVLATSRHSLDIAGEHVWRVPSLPVPTMDDSSPDVLRTYDSVALFCERATEARPGFELDSGTGPSVGEVCRRLDGIPLAIELAAGMVAVMTPAEITTNLGGRLRLLRQGRRSVLPRHRSLLEALEWSHDLLTPSEQTLLRRLSVFAGGSTLEAVEAVCQGGEVDGPEVLHLLASLSNKSLVSAEPAGTITRYRLLESIRQFGLEKLAKAGEEQSLKRNHAGWCLSLAEEAEPHLTGHDQQDWLERVAADYANLRAALEWARHHDVERGLRLAGALVLFWRVRGQFTEGRGWLASHLEQADGVRAAVRAKALWGYSFLSLMLGEEAAAVRAVNESIELFDEIGDPQGGARARLILGNHLALENSEEAVPVLERSVALSRESDDNWCLAHALAVSGIAHTQRGDTAAARAVLEESVAVSRRSGDAQGLRLSLAALGDVVAAAGEYARAEVLVREALGVVRQLGDTFHTAVALLTLGNLAVFRGQFDVAKSALDDCLGLARRAGNVNTVAAALNSLGRLAQGEDDPAAAERRFEDSMSVLRDPGASPFMDALIGLGRSAHIRGDVGLARAQFERALGLARDAGDKRRTATALHGLATLARSEGDHAESLRLSHEALHLRAEPAQRPSIAQSLAALGGLAADGGDFDRAARLLAASEEIRQSSGYVRSPHEQSQFDADVAAVREALGAEEMEDAWRQEQRFSIDEAVAYAAKGRGSRRRPKMGWDSLTNAELGVADLVSRGLSNTEVAERLFVSRRTVRSHLYKIYTKLGISSRVQLALEATRRRQEPSHH